MIFAVPIPESEAAAAKQGWQVLVALSAPLLFAWSFPILPFPPSSRDALFTQCAPAQSRTQPSKRLRRPSSAASLDAT
jgi:hypothetical protein